MNDGQLMKMKSGLEADVERLEAQLASDREKHEQMLSELTSQMEGMRSSEADAKKERAEATEAHSKKKAEVASKVSDALEAMDDVVQDTKDTRAETAALREAVANRLREMASCGCSEPSLLGVAASARQPAMTAQPAQVKEPSSDKIQQAIEIGELETRRNDLEESVSQELKDFSAQQHALLGSKDRLRVAQQLRASQQGAEAKAESGDADILGRQQGAAERYLEVRRAQLERAKADAVPLKAKYDELEAAMKQCGCGPSA